MKRYTGLIADDEPLLRERLRTHLAALWPELELLDDARNGPEALELFALHHPDIVFLDIHMPGQNGIDVARQLARRAHLVFVTAYEQYAVQAFQQGAIDYVVKPIDRARLVEETEGLAARIAMRIGDCLRDAGLTADAVDAVFLTGGSTKLVHVHAAILATVPEARVVDGDIFGSVGTGLTIEAAKRYGTAG